MSESRKIIEPYYLGDPCKLVHLAFKYGVVSTTIDH